MKQMQFVSIRNIIAPTESLRTTGDYKAMEELIQSIKQFGVLQPVILNMQGTNLFLVSGQRRLAAAKTAGLTEIPAYIIQASDEDTELIRLHENLFREELPPVSEAQALLYLEQHYHITREKIATLMGKSKGWVTQRIDILSWSPELQGALTLRLITFSVGRELAKITDPAEQKRLLDIAIESGATVRVISTWVGEWQQKQIKSAEQITAEEKDQVYKEVAELKTGPCFTCADDHPETIHVIGVCNNCFEQLKSLCEEPAAPAPGPDSEKIA
jgi:ParB family chromosome partitioning protein